MTSQTEDSKTSNLASEISWEAPEYQEYQKHPMWFVAFGVTIALLVLFGIFTESWTTAITFFLIGVMGIVYASRKPEFVRTIVSSNGIQVNNLEYSYKTVKKFWIVYNQEVKCLYLETSAYLNSLVRLELGAQDPIALRAFLKQYIEEDLEREESFIDAVARKVKF